MSGSAFLLKIGDGGSPVSYMTVAGLRVTQLSVEPGAVRVSGAGVFTGSSAETRIRANALSGMIDDYRLCFEGGETMTGRFLITRLDYAGEFSGERSYALSLESTGPVVSA